MIQQVKAFRAYCTGCGEEYNTHLTEAADQEDMLKIMEESWLVDRSNDEHYCGECYSGGWGDGDMYPMCIAVPIEPNFLPPYRLEYDSKYITLYGQDKGYPIYSFRFERETIEAKISPNQKMHNEESRELLGYEEMVLVSCVREVRNARPRILKITDKHIVIQYKDRP